MFISAAAIKRAIQDLSYVHVFFGTSYLVLKKFDAPIGSTIPIALDAGNNEHLKKYFRLHPQSNCFFFPFNKKQNDSYWRKKKYASTSLQAINTQAFEPAIIHPKNVKEWGWKTGYEEFLKSKLIRQKRCFSSGTGRVSRLNSGGLCGKALETKPMEW